MSDNNLLYEQNQSILDKYNDLIDIVNKQTNERTIQKKKERDLHAQFVSNTSADNGEDEKNYYVHKYGEATYTKMMVDRNRDIGEKVVQVVKKQVGEDIKDIKDQIATLKEISQADKNTDTTERAMSILVGEMQNKATEAKEQASISDRKVFYEPPVQPQSTQALIFQLLFVFVLLLVTFTVTYIYRFKDIWRWVVILLLWLFFLYKYLF
tara:strand:- start:192 stop:821 length:630 start_codon:yes stop_codon:yes gene_type:complete